MDVTVAEGLGHLAILVLSGFSFWLMRAGRDNVATILIIGLLGAGVYFLGWLALLTVVAGILVGARIYAKAIAAGQDPFSNPWRSAGDDDKDK